MHQYISSASLRFVARSQNQIKSYERKPALDEGGFHIDVQGDCCIQCSSLVLQLFRDQYLLPILVVAGHVLGEGAQWRRTDATGLAGAIAHHLGVDCTRHTVVELRIELGKHVRVPDAGLGDITDGGSLHNVADDELLDRLILGHAAGAVGAAHGLHMAAVVLVASSVTALLGHPAGCFSSNRNTPYTH